MAHIWSNGKPAAVKWPLLPYVSAATIGLVYIAVMGGTWFTLKPEPLKITLQQAVNEFDAGHLAQGTGEFHKLADRGDPHAAYWYGHALEHGLGTPPDIKSAIAQYEKAAAGGVIQADARLGELYLNGDAVVPDFAKARSYLTTAAKHGDTPAALALANMLNQGIGGPADPVGAYAWLELASLEGNVQARTERDNLLALLTPAQQAAAIQQAKTIAPAENR